jgi:predicted nucleic-acid-binding protein
MMKGLDTDVLVRYLVRDDAKQALHDYKEGRGDLADYLIGRINQALGCDATASL